MSKMTRGDYDKQMLDDFAFAIVALRLRPDDYWAMSRAEFHACVDMWRKLNGAASEDHSQEVVDQFSGFLTATFGGDSEQIEKE